MIDIRLSRVEEQWLARKYRALAPLRALLAVSIAMFWIAFAPPARSALSEKDPQLQKSATFDTQLPHVRVNQEHRRGLT
jgi:hypothetical protein